MGFFAHTGGSYQGFTPLAASTFDTLLDDIVADVAAAVAAGKANGWELWDDQRTLAGHAGGVYATPVAIGGYAQNVVGGVQVASGSTALKVVPAGRLLRRFTPGWTEVAQGNVDAAATLTWRTVASVTNDTDAILSAAWPGATGSGFRNFVEKAAGYVVLKCSSAQRTFYVQLVRPRSYGDALRVRVFADWDRVAHAPGGSGRSSNTEILRAYPTNTTGADGVRYVLWLLPDALSIWTEGQSGHSEGADLAYVGNLIPDRAGDSGALALLCSNTELSGWGPACGNSTQTTQDATDGGVQLLLSESGDKEWQHVPQYVQYPDGTVGTLHARAPIYASDPYRLLLDDANSLPMSALDVYRAAPRSAMSIAGRRGELRHLRVPCGNPSNQHLVAFGPDPDGHTHLMVRTGRPYARFSTGMFSAEAFGAVTIGADSSPTCCSAFAHAGRYNASSNDVVTSGALGGWYSRWFLLPMDL